MNLRAATRAGSLPVRRTDSAISHVSSAVGMPSPWTATSRKLPLMLIRGPQSGMTGPGAAWTGTLPTSWLRISRVPPGYPCRPSTAPPGGHTARRTTGGRPMTTAMRQSRTASTTRTRTADLSGSALNADHEDGCPDRGVLRGQGPGEQVGRRAGGKGPIARPPPGICGHRPGICRVPVAWLGPGAMADPARVVSSRRTPHDRALPQPGAVS